MKTPPRPIAALMSLQGRRALVTGAAGHLGHAFALTLAELGADLVLVDRPGVAFAPLQDALAAFPGRHVTTVTCDLEASAERQRLIAAVTGDGRGLAVLVNNAGFVGTTGLQGWVTDFAHQSVETWRRALEVNLTAAFELAQGLSPLLAAGRGNIINVASIYGLYGPDHRLYDDTPMGNPAAYAASKGGLLQLTRWLATTLAPQVRVNALSPGGIARGQPQAFVSRYVARTPLQRMASEEDLCGALAYLASDLSAYVTGQNLVVDGGWGIW